VSDVDIAYPEAILWDMDGTIIDSEEYWIVAETELVELFGGSWTHEQGLALVGNGLGITAEVLQNSGVTLTPDEIIQTLTTRVLEQLDVAIPWRPGAPELMQEFHRLGIPQAMVTMSIERMARSVARLIPENPLTVVVAGDNVINPKPDPEAYLRAAEDLGVNVTRCIAFEDSPAGCSSASRASAFTIGVKNIVDLDNAPLDVYLQSLAGVSAEDIISLAQDRLSA
jgi:beta-phosphoglucomutase-like phosphatase (HAD superfamily)